jgi:hypothetical protein
MTPSDITEVPVSVRTSKETVPSVRGAALTVREVPGKTGPVKWHPTCVIIGLSWVYSLRHTAVTALASVAVP